MNCRDFWRGAILASLVLLSVYTLRHVGRERQICKDETKEEGKVVSENTYVMGSNEKEFHALKMLGLVRVEQNSKI